MTAEEKNKSVTDLFEQAMKNYEQALKTGLKLQEEAARMWTTILPQSNSLQDLERRMKLMADEILPQTQKSIEEGLKLVEQNSRASVELLKKAVAAAQSGSALDAQAKWLGFWESSLNAMRDNALALSQANARAVDTWMGFARKVSVTPQPGSKA
jgi:hypothetical protein